MKAKKGSVQSYRDLIAWQRSFALAIECYRVALTLPAYERFGLASRRAASSVPFNIAEGNGRMGTGDYVRFLRIAHGSLRELETHVLLAEALGYIDPATSNRLQGMAAETGKLLGGLIRSLVRKQEWSRAAAR
jgi:four helix bundle protein